MSQATILAGIKGILDNVSGIGMVYDRDKSSRSLANWIDLMTKDGKVNGWTIRRSSVRATKGVPERIHSFTISGIYQHKDSTEEDENSFPEFEALVDDIIDAFEADPTLGGSALGFSDVRADNMRLDVEGADETIYHKVDIFIEDIYEFNE